MDLKLYISPKVEKKIKDKHSVAVWEVREVWDQYNGITLEDNREPHRSDPATLWFVAATKGLRILKVIFVPRDDIETAFLRSCYEADPNAIRIFRNKGGVI